VAGGFLFSDHGKNGGNMVEMMETWLNMAINMGRFRVFMGNFMGTIPNWRVVH